MNPGENYMLSGMMIDLFRDFVLSCFRDKYFFLFPEKLCDIFKQT
jgi:hypothetical protein